MTALPAYYILHPFFLLDLMDIAMERLIEKLMYASRWIMAPVYLGLSLVLVALAIKFFQEIIHVLPIILPSRKLTSSW